tara:strand:- start:125 stop:580 length:456 start_codon:yes stop_codon:yes gene_type:complete
MVTIFLFGSNTNTLAVEIIDEIKKESKSVIKTLTRKSLKKEETIKFLKEYVIIFDDKRGDGIVTYYFEDIFYKRYKDLNLISEDKWGFSMLGKLKVFNNNNKNTWKIQPSKINTINIKKKVNSLGELYQFSYRSKTDFYLELEEKKINLSK